LRNIEKIASCVIEYKVIMVRKIGMLSLVTSIIIVSTLFPGCTEVSDDMGEDFVFTDIDGNIWHLSDFKGKVVIMDLWATWCSPCSAQMVELKELYGDYPRDKLEILSINIDPNESFQKIQDYLDSAKEFGPVSYTHLTLPTSDLV